VESAVGGWGGYVTALFTPIKEDKPVESGGYEFQQWQLVMANHSCQI